MSTNPRKIVILNQAANYLTIGFCNAFAEQVNEVVLITGSVHVQGEALSDKVKIQYINQWHEAPASKKAVSYFTAILRMWWLLMTKYRHHEVFFVSVPPMGYLLNLILPHRFSMVIWDVYPDVFKIAGMKESHPVYRIWAWLNRKSFKKAYKLFTISEKMAEVISQYITQERIYIQPIWSIFQKNDKIERKENPFIKAHNLENKFVVQYSGNIGLTHNVEALIEIAAYLQHQKHIIFQIIGRGPRKAHLEKLVKEKDLPNCHFLPFQSDEMFPYSLSAANLGVVILDETVSKGSVPSKSYNLMSYGIPSLYIAAKDSQLNIYSNAFNHAQCFTKAALKQAADFILKISNDAALYKVMSENSEKASLEFRRANADKFVEKYLA